MIGLEKLSPVCSFCSLHLAEGVPATENLHLARHLEAIFPIDRAGAREFRSYARPP